MLNSERIYQVYLDELAEIDNELNNLSLHAKCLSEYLNCFDNYTNCATWFHIASSINELDYDGIVYDDSFYMCRPAYEYQKEKQILYKEFVREINIFLYIYSGLECLISICNFPQNPQFKGKIYATTFAMKEHFDNISPMLKCYDRIVRLCEKMYISSFDNNYSISKEFNSAVDIWGVGLKMVYRIRNQIMHGDFFFPEPIDYGSEIPFHAKIVYLCSRLTLVNIQMILLINRKDNFLDPLELYRSSILKDDEGYYVNEKNYLKGMHVKQIDFNEDQYKLKFL